MYSSRTDELQRRLLNTLLWDASVEGLVPADTPGIAQRLGVPLVDVAEALADLETAGWITFFTVNDQPAFRVHARPLCARQRPQATTSGAVQC